MDTGWFKDYQTLIVGVVGFAGVILTLIQNAKIARAVRRDNIEHERATLRIALVEELSINLDALRGNLASIDQLPQNGDHGAFMPTDPMDDVYKSFVGKIGLLTENEVREVMGAYLYLRTLTARLFLIGVPPHTGPQHVQIPPENLVLLRAELEAAVPIVEQAREALRRASTAV